MDSTPARDHLIRQLEALERQVLSLRAQLLPEPPAPIREAFSVVGITVGASPCALRTSAVRRLIPLVSWQPLPESPSWVLGLFRYRGQTRLLVDLHQRLHETKVPLSPSMIIVVTKEPESIGLVATGVTSLIHVEPEQVTAPPKDSSYAPFITGEITTLGGHILHILSVPRLRRELVLGSSSPEAPISAPISARTLTSELPES